MCVPVAVAVAWVGQEEGTHWEEDSPQGNNDSALNWKSHQTTVINKQDTKFFACTYPDGASCNDNC